VKIEMDRKVFENMRGMKDDRLVTADLLEHLPEPVRRYMNYTGVVGKPWINTVRVKYAGKFRMAADKPWMPITAVQFYTTNPPGFVWKAWIKMAGLPLLYGHDTYRAGHGHMFGKLAGIFTIFDARGEELDQGTMLRYLNEATWFPTALLGENISWQGVDDHTADVTFTDSGKSVSARFFFDDVGRLTNFRAQRYRENKGKYSLDTWETPMVEYGTLAGLNLPIRGSGVWKLPTGDLPYIDIALEEVEYKCPVEII
jgi:hypothetical protein